jgi:hypothetical protein
MSNAYPPHTNRSIRKSKIGSFLSRFWPFPDSLFWNRLNLVGADAAVGVAGNIGPFDGDAFTWGLPMHHSAPDRGEEAERMFDDGVEIV